MRPVTQHSSTSIAAASPVTRIKSSIISPFSLILPCFATNNYVNKAWSCFVVWVERGGAEGGLGKQYSDRGQQRKTGGIMWMQSMQRNTRGKETMRNKQEQKAEWQETKTKRQREKVKDEEKSPRKHFSCVNISAEDSPVAQIFSFCKCTRLIYTSGLWLRSAGSFQQFSVLWYTGIMVHIKQTNRFNILDVSLSFLL